MSAGVRIERRPRRSIRMSPGRMTTMVVALVLMVGAGYLLSPLLLRDRGVLTQAPDTSGPVRGAAAAFSDALRDAGMTCSDLGGVDVLVRLCSKPDDRGGAVVRFVADPEGQLASLSADLDTDPKIAAVTITAVFAAAAIAFSLPSDARAQLLADAATTSGQLSRSGDWGSYALFRQDSAAELDLVASEATVVPQLPDSLPWPLERARAIAEQRGYACSLARAGSLACERDANGYSHRLYIEPGTDSRISRLDYEVASDRRAGVLGVWNHEFAAFLADLGGTAAPISDWLAANPRAGGADDFIGPVELSYRVDLDAYAKEVFGVARTPNREPSMETRSKRARRPIERGPTR